MPRKGTPTEPPEEDRSAADYMPSDHDLEHLKEAACRCHGCDLYKAATQTVFGEGNQNAKVMLIGEEPGDVEDQTGHVFVGPAGKLLNKALEAAGIEREQCYLTNAVKHFKFEWVGKRRLHKKPRAREVTACMPWLQAEIAEIKPEIIICLGATAAQALLGRAFRITQHRGEMIESDYAPYVMATVHPSSILRAPDSETRHLEMDRFIEDLKKAAGVLKRKKH
jgi:uracil-DNA glycosylase family protein